MVTTPDELPVEATRDLEGRHWEPWARRAGVLVLLLIPVLALTGRFGQLGHTTTVSAPAAVLRIDEPYDVRGGLLYGARFTITARSFIKDATLVLGRDWADGLTINTIEPSPVSETSDQGRLAFSLGPLNAGDVYQLHMQFQVNPITVGTQVQTVSLYDGPRPIAQTVRHLMVWP